LGAIRSSIGNVSKTLQQTIRDLPVLFQMLAEKDTALFFDLIELSLQNTEIKTSIEERERRQSVAKQLAQAGCSKAAAMADTLVDMHIYTCPEAFLPLLNNPQGGFILNIAYRLTGLQRNTVTIVTATERAARIVNALKNYVYQNDQDIKVPVNICEELETVLTLFHNKTKHDVEVIKQYGQIPEIMGYRDELNQVWTNLITNALQAIEYKGRLEITVCQEHGYINVQITDNGKGISNELKSKIFNPFFPTNKRGAGAGRVLTIFKKIIQKHLVTITF
jgi:signal transduction histidine kinase